MALTLSLLCLTTAGTLLATLRQPPASPIQPRALRLLGPSERPEDFPGESAVRLDDLLIDWRRAPFDTVRGAAPPLPDFQATAPNVWRRPAPWQLADAYNGWEVTYATNTMEEPRACCRTRDLVGACRCPQGPTVGVAFREGERGLVGGVRVAPLASGTVNITALPPPLPLTAEFTSDGAPTDVSLTRGGVSVRGVTPCTLTLPDATGPVIVGASAPEGEAALFILMTATAPPRDATRGVRVP